MSDHVPDSELEQRLHTMLATRAQQARLPAELAVFSRRRARRRRTRFVGAGVVLAVVAVLGAVTVVPRLVTSTAKPGTTDPSSCPSTPLDTSRRLPTIEQVVGQQIQRVTLCRFTNPSTGDANADRMFELTDEVALSDDEIAAVQSAFAVAEATGQECFRIDSPPPVSVTVRLQDRAGSLWSVSVPLETCLGLDLGDGHYTAPHLPGLLDALAQDGGVPTDTPTGQVDCAGTSATLVQGDLTVRLFPASERATIRLVAGLPFSVERSGPCARDLHVNSDHPGLLEPGSRPRAGGAGLTVSLPTCAWVRDPGCRGGIGEVATYRLSFEEPPHPGGDAPVGIPVDLPTSGWQPGDRVDFTGLVSGVLALDEDHCVYLGGENKVGGGVYVVWPAGFTAAITDHTLRLFDPAGRVVADGGQMVETRGGSVPASAAGSRSGCVPNSGEVALVEGTVHLVPVKGRG
ncbi:MAG: hypothetical protein JWN22_933 [Nocardioides sp.]|jgi:hypothetical protein|nr:hypothetical protein [Nocardioides sp.]